MAIGGGVEEEGPEEDLFPCKNTEAVLKKTEVVEFFKDIFLRALSTG